MKKVFIRVCLMACPFFINYLSAKVIKYDNYITKTEKYSFKEVCHSLTKRESPLIEIDSYTHLNCMGKSLNVSSFCQKVQAHNPYYTKAYISKENKKVHCESANRVIIKYQCSKKDNKKYCNDKDVGCFLLKEKMAYRLKLVHSSLDKDILSCYFGLKEQLSI